MYQIGLLSQGNTVYSLMPYSIRPIIKSWGYILLLQNKHNTWHLKERNVFYWGEIWILNPWHSLANWIQKHNILHSPCISNSSTICNCVTDGHNVLMAVVIVVHRSAAAGSCIIHRLIVLWIMFLLWRRHMPTKLFTN